MERIDRILDNKTYQRILDKTSEYEKDRKFCVHDRNHLLSVARIAMVLNDEEALGLEKYLVYAAALVHDCGRAKEYETAVRHEIGGVEIAQTILEECGFTKEDIKAIQYAIRNHRNWEEAQKESLSSVIYRADKLSRECYWCEVKEECNRNMEKRTKNLRY